MKTSLLLATLIAAAAVGAPRAEAQDVDAPRAEPSRPIPRDSLELVDRIVAVVGDTVVLRSDIVEEILQLGAQGAEIPPHGTAAFDSLLTRTLDGMVDELILLQRAERSQIVLTNAELDDETERRMDAIRGNFPSTADFRQAVERSGRTLAQFREYLRSQVWLQFMVNRFVAQNRDQLPPASVTDEEIQRFFEENYAGATRPATISFHRIVIEPTPSEAAADSAQAIAERALRELRQGTEFEVVARRYSEDPATRDEGGELGWVRRGQVVPAFADAAWRAPPGEPVGPVETRFGYHIIRVENVRGGERRLSHILIRPEISGADVERAHELGEALADSIRGGAEVEALADRYGVEDVQVRIDAVVLEQVGERFGPAYAEALSGPLPGEVVGPFRADAPGGDPAFAVVRVDAFTARGDWKLEQAAEEIRGRLEFAESFDRFIAELRDEVYVDVRL